MDVAGFGVFLLFFYFFYGHVYYDFLPDPSHYVFVYYYGFVDLVVSLDFFDEHYFYFFYLLVVILVYLLVYYFYF